MSFEKMRNMFSEGETSNAAPYCLLCGSAKNLRKCGRCGNAQYCSKEHQILHWEIHGKICKQNSLPVCDKNSVLMPPNGAREPAVNLSEIISDLTSLSSDELELCNWINDDEKSAEAAVTEKLYASSESSRIPGEISQASEYDSTRAEIENFENVLAAAGLGDDLYQTPLESNQGMFSSLSSELLSSANKYWDIIKGCETGNFSVNLDLDIPFEKQDEKVVQTVDYVPAVTEKVQNPSADIFVPSHTSSVEAVCQNVIRDLNEYGICVLRDFLGSTEGDLVLAEVKALFMKGIFKKGELVSSGMLQATEDVRNDVITWITGNEEGCSHISALIQKLDFIITTCNRMANNGILSNYKLHKRTKAMVACYPGDGTYYKKHIDNPHGDGRCITCIYYLNKKWDTKKHGGLLRMFPVQMNSHTADIEPLFDRMLFFWSDRRNPHEVLPSFAVRFAITVWYFDSDERDRALAKYRNQEKL